MDVFSFHFKFIPTFSTISLQLKIYVCLYGRLLAYCDASSLEGGTGRRRQSQTFVVKRNKKTGNDVIFGNIKRPTCF